MATVSAPPTATDNAIEQLAATIRGSVLTSAHADYDAARAVYNAMIDRHPAVIVRCVDVADVMAALAFARPRGLLVSVRGGGHSAPGYGVNDGGIVIDLSPMRHVVVHPGGERVSVGGGATWGDVDHATVPFGRAVPAGVVSTTGVGGLTLGGGTGHLTRAFGLTCDSLLAADVVTADGELVRADAVSHPELFWALRGGGGNFGVVTNFEFRLHPVRSVLAGAVFYDLTAPGALLRRYRDFMHGTPSLLGAFFAFGLAPPIDSVPTQYHGRPVGMVVVCWPGEPREGWDVIGPLLADQAVIGRELADMSIAELNSMEDASAPPGLHNYWRGQFLEDLTDDVIDVHATLGPTVPNLSSAVHLYPIDGAASRVGPSETAFSHRDARYSTVVAALWDNPTDTEACVAWVRDYWSALQATRPAAGYVNFLSLDDGDRGVEATYRDNYARLAAVKAAYDPTNLFRMNPNVQPAPTAP